MKPELIFYNGANLLEAVHYDRTTQIMYFCAIRYNTIFAFNIKTLAITSYETEGPVGNAIVDKNGNIYEAEKFGIYTINPKTFEKNFVAHINPNPKMRYNHGVFDSKGRFLVDIMGREDFIHLKTENQLAWYTEQPLQTEWDFRQTKKFYILPIP